MAYSLKRPKEERRQLQNANAARYRERHPDRHGESQKRFKERHPDRLLAMYSKYNRKRRTQMTPEEKRARVEAENERRKKVQQEAISHYGGRCYCCGETIYLLLCLDHKNGGGCQHRKELKGMRLAQWAKNHGWPDVLRVACHSCNFGAHLNGGICPHQMAVK
jgi:hypothetical protein